MKQRQEGLEFPKRTCSIGKMKGENENTVRQYRLKASHLLGDGIPL